MCDLRTITNNKIVDPSPLYSIGYDPHHLNYPIHTLFIMQYFSFLERTYISLSVKLFCLFWMRQWTTFKDKHNSPGEFPVCWSTSYTYTSQFKLIFIYSCITKNYGCNPSYRSTFSPDWQTAQFSPGFVFPWTSICLMWTTSHTQ